MYIIDFVDGTSRSLVDQYFTDNNLVVEKEYDSLGLVFKVQSSSSPPVTPIIERISLDQDLTIVPLEIQYKNFPMGEEDEHWWKIATVNIKDFETEIIEHPLNHSKVNVYIVDSGIKIDHQEFTGVDITNLYTYDNDYNDTHGHGTAIASIISGNRCSLATAKIKNLKIFGDTPTYQSHLLNALDAILKDNAADPKPGIVNISWSIPKNSYVESKFQKLIDNNILVVCAAGNNGMPIQNVTPASMLDAITVGSYNKDFLPSNFSNYTNPNAITNTNNEVNYGEIDIWAPGEQIFVATLDGGYGYVAGTSIATAIESLALAYQLGDRFGIDQVSADDLKFLSLKYYFSSNECSKVNLLTLEGNYAASVNRITNIHSQYSNAYNYTTRFFPFLRANIFTGQEFSIPFYLPRYSESLITLNSLPDGITIENGYLRGLLNLEQDENIRTLTIEVIHQSRNSEYNATQNILLILRKENYDYENDPNVDPTLNYELLVSAIECINAYEPVYGNGYCGVQCINATTYCIDYYYFCMNIKTTNCVCASSCD